MAVIVSFLRITVATVTVDKTVVLISDTLIQKQKSKRPQERTKRLHLKNLRKAQGCIPATELREDI